MSSGSESDEEYVPGEPEQLSEEGSADEETDLQFEREQEYKAKKRKAVGVKTGKKKLRTRNAAIKDEEVEGKQEESVKVNPEEEKKKEDDLWAKFLDGTDTKPKPEAKVTRTFKDTAEKSSSESSKDVPIVPNVPITKQTSEDDQKEKERKIFEFAGETIIVENNVIKETIKSKNDSSAAANFFQGPSRSKKGGGLSSVLGALNSKNKLSTLEKSKLDWETYKKKEGIEDEVKNFNKGKGGYLERQDFLQRTDLRQYELEREVRMNKRSNR